MKNSLIESGVEEALAKKATDMTMNEYTRQPKLDLLSKAIEYVKKLQENPDKPIQLSPEIPRADITLDIEKLEPMNNFIEEQNQNDDPNHVPELLKKYGFGFDYERDVEL
ncbi:hypothetical protein [Endozoicomonas sp. SCSIO W0465]|uniref:hypothetical protein n=1 Tax=Endozoicomonas sp. SCSIO W0465 TaxID=2918516 RepID=UPI00207564CD|nr:hypothetical protein [Endozoicomonas sp. SCSIO W0465]USE34999.1 hypothetical protein MJO57_23190 [Endozoicomonas sp. SCSIO W0465]